MKKFAIYTAALISMLSINKLSSQVVINEIQMQPAGSSTGTNPQNLADCAPNSGAEFIELYNTNQCASVDISCYILGTNIAGTSAAAHGAFRFPAGTTIPPLGFISIGGINSGATFILNTYCGTQNLAINPAGRWYLPNGDGYMMLYDATGAAVDAVYWTTGSTAADQAKWGADSDINTNPTRIPAGTGGCAIIASLPGPANIPIASAEWMGQAAGNGLSCSRQTDGSSTWVNNVAGTVNACNGACVVANTFYVPANVTQPSCSSNNGVITITPSPVGAYTYNWSPNVSTTNTASSLSGGTYSISISSGGCQKDTVITLTASNAPTNIAVNVTNASCGQSNGSVTLGAVTGGTGPYQYNFNSLGLASTAAYNSLAAGNYSLIVSDNNGCTYTAPSVVISNGSAPTAIVVNTVNASCGQSNGSVTLGAVTGGTGPYQYNFNNLGLSNNTSYSGLIAGIYSLIIVDNNGCSYTTSTALISSNPTFSISTEITEPSCANNDGNINITNANGGTAPYEYNFNNVGFGTNPLFENLASGNYNLIVKDNNGCINSFDLTVPQSADESTLYTPNCFTPNFDDVNEFWKSYGTCILEYKCFIFNRWGEKIATLNSLDEKWDGTYKGKTVSDGVYVYVVEATDAKNLRIKKSGHITLLR
jgi:gliding motility-associated-like protein